jgi:hypothetical protein
MSKKIEQLDMAKRLLDQALRAAYRSMPNNPTVSEARSDMRRAIKKLDRVSKKQSDQRKKMTQDQYKEWWGELQAGTAQLADSPMSPEAQQRSLAQLDAMIDAEKEKLQKLQDLEKQSTQTDDQLLQD